MRADGWDSPRLCGEGLVGLPVMNSGAAGWLRNVRVKSKDAGVTARVADDGKVAASFEIAPGQLRIVPISLTLPEGATKGACPFGVNLELRASADGDGEDDDAGDAAHARGEAQTGGSSQLLLLG